MNAHERKTQIERTWIVRDVTVKMFHNTANCVKSVLLGVVVFFKKNNNKKIRNFERAKFLGHVIDDASRRTPLK